MMRAIVPLAAAFALLSGCTSLNKAPTPVSFDHSRLPSADIHLNIAGLGNCNESTNRTLNLNSKQPVTILVHGDHSSAGKFRALAEVMAFHGQQTACFDYDDRDSLMRSSAQLAAALDALNAEMHHNQLTLIGHDLGALVARKALVAKRPDAIKNKDALIRLVTISGPFSGIASAQHCGSPSGWEQVLTLGLNDQLCKISSGDKWHEVTAASDFIQQPGELLTAVLSHLKIVSDERDACRHSEAGTCVERDYTFSLGEQYFLQIDKSAIVKNVEIKAGHLEIVGGQHVAPLKLIGILQEYGILNQTEAARHADFDRLLSKLY
jgi:pimeloyl-ACP methyl ester carboxylesterase